MKIELIKGHSGCSLELIVSNSQNLIRKSTQDINYIHRLEKQCMKQKDYIVTENFFEVPKINYFHKDANIFFFDMEYIFAQDAIRYLENTNIDKVDIFIDYIIKIIDLEIKNSKIINVNKNILVEKVKDVESKIEENSYGNLFKYSIQRIYEILQTCSNELTLPIGICHGDLTLSNILVKNEKLILIDFLDSFIETPLQDIVKIRQDTKHLWSFNMIEEDFDKTKLSIILSYMDDKVKKHFKQYDFMKYYQLFQMINLIRIVPYTQNNVIMQYLQKELNNIQE